MLRLASGLYYFLMRFDSTRLMNQICQNCCDRCIHVDQSTQQEMFTCRLVSATASVAMVLWTLLQHLPVWNGGGEETWPLSWSLARAYLLMVMIQGQVFSMKESDDGGHGSYSQGNVFVSIRMNCCSLETFLCLFCVILDSFLLLSSPLEVSWCQILPPLLPYITTLFSPWPYL